MDILLPAFIAALTSIIILWANRFFDKKKRVRDIKSKIIKLVYFEYRLLDLGCYFEIYFNYYKRLFDCTSNDTFLLPQGIEQKLAEAQHSESKYKIDYYSDI